jgi:multicomponent Na+:H+ antiporter subunit A
MTSVATILLVAFAAPAVTWGAGRLRSAWAARAALISALATLVTVVLAWSIGGLPLDVPWLPAWGARLALALDGLAALYAILAAGIGALVVWYSTSYIPSHLASHDRPEDDVVRFHTLLTLFMAAMIGLAVSQDLLLLFVFFDLTAVTSYFLIGYDSESEDARSSALMALLVTGIASVVMLVGILAMHRELGTFSIPALLAAAEGRTLDVPVALIAIGALAKSAQVPFHFWLPRAMAAPTPVSAYLHSAAMVAAGVFVLQRLAPLLEAAPWVRTALVVIGLSSIATGSLLALTSERIKGLLAYSTIAQYGYVVTLLGVGGGATASVVYVAAHALAKSALFLVAGAVTHATDEDRFARVGGLARSMPLLAAGAAFAAAGLAGLPLTAGFFKDEVFFGALARHGGIAAAAAAGAAALTLAYAWRFWASLFLGRAVARSHRVSSGLLAPPLLLALAVVLVGVMPAPLERLANAARQAIAPGEHAVDLAYHLDARVENLLALAAWATAAVLVMTRRWWIARAERAVHAGRAIGPEHLYHVALGALNTFSARLMAVERRDLRGRLAAVLGPSAILVAVAFVATGGFRHVTIGSFARADVPLAAALVLAMAAAVGVTLRRRHITLVLSVSTVGYSLSAVYALLGAPDVALVAVLVETAFTLLLVGILALFPVSTLATQARRRVARSVHRRNQLLAAGAAGLAAIVGWSALSHPAHDRGVAAAYIELAEAAHAKDVVTAILADFRGLDTLGEITVVAIVLAGFTSLLARARGR